MATVREILNQIFVLLKRTFVLNALTKAILVLGMCAVIIPAVYYSQKWSEETSLPPIVTTSPKEQYEIAKLAAEIRQIRSDTSGSLFWLKMIALFVTVGGAVGGYLAGQSRVASRRIEFENRKSIESVYQTIVQELSEEAPLLRASAAVKLGNILRSFPTEWVGDDPKDKNWKVQQIQLTKQVLAASLSIEQDRKVLKTLTIALVLHKRWEEESKDAVGQSPAILNANIPFAFDAGDKTLPPGDYTVSAVPSSTDALTITDGKGKSTRILSTDPIAVVSKAKTAKLVFHFYGERNFLSQVWPAGKAEYRQLPKSRQEETLAAQTAVSASPPTGDMEILDRRPYGDARELDLSGAKAADAYWASTDFSYSDFYKADLRGASFRRSVLNGAEFRDANLREAVFIDANCAESRFMFADLSQAKLRNADLSNGDFRKVHFHDADLSNANLRNADLRDADLTKATLYKTRFQNAKVHECKLTNAKKVGDNHPDDKVDDSVDGDGTGMITVSEWLERETKPKAGA